MTKIKNGSLRESLKKSKNNYIMKNPIGDFKLRTNLPIESISFFYDFFSPGNPLSSDPQMFDPHLLEIKYLQIHKREIRRKRHSISFEISNTNVQFVFPCNPFRIQTKIVLPPKRGCFGLIHSRTVC